MRNHRLAWVSAGFAAAFLLCGALRVLTYHKDLMEGFSSWSCALLLLFWTERVRARVTDRRLRRLIVGTAASLFGFLLVQLFRGILSFGRPALQRYCWYGYYIPYITTPLLLFFCSVAVYRPQRLPLPRWIWVVAAAVGALALCALTNDLHQLMFRFPGGVFRDTDEYSPGPLFWPYFVCYGALLLASLRVTLHKAWMIRRGLSFLLPAIPLLLLGLWMVGNLYHIVPSFHGVKPWIESTCFSFAFTACLEMCIQIGLFPSNSGYVPLFSRIELSAAILDADASPVRRSGGLQYPFPEGADLDVRTQPIDGGSVTWAVDLRPVHALNRKLSELNRRLEQRSVFLREEGQMKKERAELETRNRLYEEISRVVGSQLSEIEALSEGSDAEFIEHLPRISVLTAFVKRRSNMELLAAGGTLTVEELGAALTESLAYLRLCGVQTAVTVSQSGELPAAVVISAYEHVQALIMEGLDTMQALFVRAAKDGPTLELRLMLRTDNLSWDFARSFPGSSVRPGVRISIDNGDLSVILRFAEGGAA